MKKCEWILCPICGNKTRDKMRKDTVTCKSFTSIKVSRLHFGQ